MKKEGQDSMCVYFVVIFDDGKQEGIYRTLGDAQFVVDYWISQGRACIIEREWEEQYEHD